jgi:hypothetical protein
MTMQDHENSAPTVPKHKAWNKGKLIGPKPPLRPKHGWSIFLRGAFRQEPGFWRRLLQDRLFAVRGPAHGSTQPKATKPQANRASP